MSGIFRLEIRCEGAAFGRGYRSVEVAEILRGVADSIENDRPLEFASFEHSIRDSNGNTCGTLGMNYDD